MTDLFDPFAFAVGMVALVNPCGFALLPAYLGFFLGQRDEEPSRIVSLNRAQGVGLAMTLGFLSVFGLVGILFTGLRSAIQDWLPYFNIVLGIGLTVLGIAMLRGFQLLLKIPKLEKGTGSTSFVSMFLFGVSYALASLSCTIGLFLTAVGTSSTSRDFVDGLGGFISYGLGMGLLASVLTLLVAFGRRGLVNRFRSILPKINLISGLLLLLVGPYMVGYGIWEIQVLNGGDVSPLWLDDFMLGAADVQASISNWFSAKVNVFGRDMSRTALLGWPFFAVNAGLVIAGFLARRRRIDDPSADDEAGMVTAAS
ncbi:MAG: cytochrome c biogenesis protein CcdA [Acidimicrobiales bacterium]|nr:cytochrome c biogenesis protein CcdA [Acidimicrobiales bacterium]